MTKQKPSYFWGWRLAVACFVLAASTGSLIRFSLIYGFPAGLQFINVRHAHSHLMYFSWATPALMALIADSLPAQFVKATSIDPSFQLKEIIATLSKRFRIPIFFTVIFGLIAYVPFLIWGYTSVQIGPAKMPPSVIGAGFTVIGWYLFAWQYRQVTKGVPRTTALRLWDSAVIFMLLATIGTWLLPGVTFAQIEGSFWKTIFAHMFLDLFAEGWFLIGLLGLAYAQVERGKEAERQTLSGLKMLQFGVPTLFLLYMPVNMMPSLVRWLAVPGGVVAALGLLRITGAVWAGLSRGWRVSLVMLATKAATQLFIALPFGARLAEGASLRIFYIHLLLLGVVSIGLFAAAYDVWGWRASRITGWFIISILVLLTSLLPLTGLWPTALKGVWMGYAAAWGTVAPILIACIVIVDGFRPSKNDST